MATFHSLGERPNMLPERGKIGDIYLWRGEVYMALPPDGRLIKTSNLLTAITALGLGRIAGPQGLPGKDGADSIVPGSKGDKGDKGDRGEQGPPGDITVLGDAELQAAITKLKKQKAAALAIALEVLDRRPDNPTVAVARAQMLRVKRALES